MDSGRDAWSFAARISSSCLTCFSIHPQKTTARSGEMPTETSSGWKGQLKRIAVFVPQHFAAADMVGRPHQPLLLHLLDQAGGAVIADPQLQLVPPGCRLLISEHPLAQIEKTSGRETGV